MKRTFFALLLLIGALLGCDKKQPVLPEKCTLVPETGHCRAAFTRYYYDPKEKRCKEFTWGGCDGVVPFETLQECKDCGCETADDD